MNNPFRPYPKSTIRIEAATASNPVDLGGLMPHGAGTQVRVRNRGTVEAFVEFGGGAVTASAPVAAGSVPGSMGIPAGAVEVFTLQFGERRIAVAVEAGAPSVEVTVGTGD